MDRHYIERFLAQHAVDVQGRVLEVGDDAYTRRFGGERSGGAEDEEAADVCNLSRKKLESAIGNELLW